MEEYQKDNQVEGTVSSIIYQNEENGYTILRLDVKGEEMTVVGPMPGVSPGEYLAVKGRWVRHATYGVQLRAETVERRLPQGLKEIYHYLASGAVKGVGKATARLLIEEFGEDTLTVLEEGTQIYAYNVQSYLMHIMERLNAEKKRSPENLKDWGYVEKILRENNCWITGIRKITV